MRTEIGGPTDTAGAASAELAEALRLLSRRLRGRLRQEAHVGDFTPSQMAVLARLEHGAFTVTALARAEGVRPQSMGATVAALTEAGLVCGQPDPSDGRRTLLSLSGSARASFQASRNARQDWLTRVVADRYTPQERTRMLAALTLLDRLFED